NSLHDLFVAVARCFRPLVVRHVQLFPEIDKLLCDVFNKLSWRNAGFRRGLPDLLAMLIDAGEENDLFALERTIPRHYDGHHLFVSVPDVWWRVCLIDRRGNENSHRL